MDTRKRINPKDCVHGRWYIVDSSCKWLIQFDKIDKDKVFDLMSYNIDTDSLGDSKVGLPLWTIKSMTEATQEEVCLHIPGAWSQNEMLDKLKEAYSNHPEKVQESFDKINAMEQPNDKSVYVYTDKEDGLIYMLPKFDPHVGGHNIDQVLSKAEDNSVIYEARPVGIKKVYLEGV